MSDNSKTPQNENGPSSIDPVMIREKTDTDEKSKSKQSTRIILVGKGGSGKDHLRRKFETRGFLYQVSYTTRPPRQGEVNGKDYWFISESEASTMEKKGEWYELVNFNNWRYGTTNAQFYQPGLSLFVMTPKALLHLSAIDRAQSFVIYLNPPQTIIEKRLRARNMPGDSVDRRIQADNEQFAKFENYDIVITNPDF